MKDLLKQLGKTASKPLEQAFGLEPRLYWNDEIATLEEENIFKKDWVCLGLAAEIAKPGDYIASAIAGNPVFVIRNKSGDIKTYSNVCRHRMMQMLSGTGSVSRIICPYHAWTYDLNGQLIGAGYMDRSDGFDKKKICLPEIKTEIWQGWIYATLNPDAQSLEQSLSPLSDVVSRYGMANYVPIVQEDHVWNTNWKLLVENFMEGYHLPVAHKATVGAWFPVEKTIFPEKTYEHFTYQTFMKSGDATYGKAHPDNKSLTGDWRNTSILPTIFPTHMYVLAPDHLWYLSLKPKGVGQVDVRFGVAIAPEVDASLGYIDEREVWISELVKFFEHVNSEDRFVVEGIYNGARSSFAKPGQLSWLEREIHDFQQYLAKRLCTAL